MPELRISQKNSDGVVFDGFPGVTGSVPTLTTDDLTAQIQDYLTQNYPYLTANTGRPTTASAVMIDGSNYPPPPPSGLALATTFRRDPVTGLDVATITAVWLPVSDDDYFAYAGGDNVNLPLIEGYMVSYQSDSNDQWSVEALVTQGNQPTFSLPGLPLNKIVQVRVRTRTKAGTLSIFVQTSITTAKDTTPPPPPSTPVVSGGVAQATVTWDGLDNTGAAMPSDFARCDCHISQTSGFTPGTGTLSDSMTNRNGGTFRLASVATGSYYAKLIAYDYSGNASTPSAQSAQFTVTTPASGDVSVGTIRNTDATEFLTATQLIRSNGATLVSDSQAFDTNAVRSAGSGSSTLNIDTNAYNSLKPGMYRATFYLRTTLAGASTQVCLLAAYSGNGTGSVAESGTLVSIAGTAFSTAGQYRGITIPVTIKANFAALQLRIYDGAGAAGSWHCSHVTIDTGNDIAPDFFRAASIVDAIIANLKVDKVIAGSIGFEWDLFSANGLIRLGNISGGAPGSSQQRLDMDNAGIRCYDSGNNPTITMSSATGAVTVTGTITGGVYQTSGSSSVRRIVIDATTATDTIYFYNSTPLSGSAAPAKILAFDGLGGNQFGQDIKIDSGRGSNTGGTGGTASFLLLRAGYGGNQGFELNAPTSYGIISTGGELRLTGGTDASGSEASHNVTITVSNGGQIVLNGDIVNNVSSKIILPTVRITGTSTPSFTFRNNADTAYVPLLASAFTVSSSSRFKDNIVTVGAQQALDLLNTLRPVQHQLKSDGSTHYGLVAEEVANAVPDLVAYHPDDLWPEGVNLLEVVPLLIAAVQDQQRQLTELRG